METILGIVSFVIGAIIAVIMELGDFGFDIGTSDDERPLINSFFDGGGDDDDD